MSVHNRNYFADFLRFFAFIAIIVFHYQLYFWYVRGLFPFYGESLLWQFFDRYCRTFYVGGHIILLITTFLISYRNDMQAKLKKIMIASIVGWVAFSAIDYHRSGLLLNWDIYSLILLAFSVAYLLSKINKKFISYLGLFSFILLTINFDRLLQNITMPYWLKVYLVGDCANDNTEWPILPWIAIPWIGLFVGQWSYQKKELFKTIKPIEIFLWLFTIASFLPYANLYERDNGPGWACSVFRLSFLETLVQIIITLFFLRLGLVTTLNEKVSRVWIFKEISNLSISKNFGLAYIVHYLLIVISYHTLYFVVKDNYLAAGLLAISICILTELVTKYLYKVVKN